MQQASFRTKTVQALVIANAAVWGAVLWGLLLLSLTGCADMARWNARMHGYQGESLPDAQPCTPTGQRMGLCVAQQGGKP